MSSKRSTEDVADERFIELDAFLREVGQRLRARRDAKRWSRKTLGRFAKVSDKHIANLERGEVGSLGVWFDLSAALGAPLAELFWGADATNATKAREGRAHYRPVRLARADGKREELVAIIRRLDGKQLETILRVARELLDTANAKQKRP